MERDTDSPEDRQQIDELMASLERMATAPCASCSGPICGHEALFSWVMGYTSAALCLGCLATAVQNDAKTMRENLFEHIQRRDCTRTSWERFNAREGFDLTGRPGCLWTGGAAPARLTSAPGSPAPPGLVGRAAPEGPAGWDDEWDAGDLGCGELTLGLRARMNKLFAGQVLRLVTGDPGALEDLSSWCRLTGHGLVSAAPPVFLIRRREV